MKKIEILHNLKTLSAFMKKLDVYSMQIVVQFLQSEEDLINSITVKSKFQNLLDRMRVNPIQITSTSKRLFKQIQTQQIFSKYDTIVEGIDNYVINYVVDYKQYLKEKGNGKKFKKIMFTSKNKDKFGESIPEGVHIVDEFCFECCTLKKIEIPNSVTEIRRKAFHSSNSLQEITIPTSVRVIGEEVFSECPVLWNIQLPSSIEVLPNSLFSECGSITTIHIPSSITKIEDGCFASCQSIEKITINPNIKYLGNSCFNGCEALTSIVLVGQKSVPDSCFTDCSNLISIHLDDCLEEIGSNAFSKCTRLVSLHFPTNLKKVGCGAFSYCESLEQVVLPPSIVNVGNNAFVGCQNLKKLIIHNDKCYIGNGLFENCLSLTEIKIPLVKGYYPCEVSPEELLILTKNNIPCKCCSKTIEFSEQLNSLIIDDEIETIVDFYHGESDRVTSLYIPSSVTTFKSTYKFKFLKELNITRLANDDLLGKFEMKGITSIKLPLGMKVIPEKCFYLCGAQNIHIPTSITRINERAFSSCKKLESIFIPSSVVCFGKCVFEGCESLKRINFENKDFIVQSEVTYKEYLKYKQNKILCRMVVIGWEEEFMTELPTDCDLRIVSALFNFHLNEIPSNVVSLHNSLFLNRQLTSLTIPSTVTSILPDCLTSLTNLKELSFFKQLAFSYPGLANGLTNLIKINVIDGSLNDLTVSYNYHLNMKSKGVFLKSIEFNDVCAEETNNPFENKKVIGFYFNYINGNITTIKSLNVNDFHSHPYLEKIELSEDIKEIPNCCFFRCYSLKTIKIPKECQRIGMYAFKHCEEIRKITIPSNVTEIEDGAFYGCKQLKDVNIHNTNINIGFDGFGECPIERITMNETMITEYPFEITYTQMKSFEEHGIRSKRIVIQRNDIELFGNEIINDIRVSRIDDCCFRNNNIKEITIPNHINQIGQFSFKDCKELIKVSIPTTIKRIPYCCFDGCVNLETIEIPNDILFDDHCFCNCLKLKDNPLIPIQFIE